MKFNSQLVFNETYESLICLYIHDLKTQKKKKRAYLGRSQ